MQVQYMLDDLLWLSWVSYQLINMKNLEFYVTLFVNVILPKLVKKTDLTVHDSEFLGNMNLQNKLALVLTSILTTNDYNRKNIGVQINY